MFTQNIDNNMVKIDFILEAVLNYSNNNVIGLHKI